MIGMIRKETKEIGRQDGFCDWDDYLPIRNSCTLVTSDTLLAQVRGKRKDWDD